MKKILLFVFALGMVGESFAQLVESRTVLTNYDMVQPQKPAKKKEWKFRLGLSASTLKGDDAKDIDDLGNLTGYQLGFEWRRFMKHGMFWGMEFNFASRGYKISDVEFSRENGDSYGYWVPNYETYKDDVKLKMHEFEWVPFNLGYRYDINKDIAVSTRLGVFVNFAMAGNYIAGDEEYGIDSDEYSDMYGDPLRANVGIKWGLGAQWKHLALDFEVQKSFIDHTDELNAQERAINLTVGYIF
ncbi:MAG: PorT family protein [Clostridium sp.]|nr:PorT family protein [Clostridium sp.]